MNIGNFAKSLFLVYVIIIVSMFNSSLLICDDQLDTSGRFICSGKVVPVNSRTGSFFKLGYKPVMDECPYPEDKGKLYDNFLYKKWCEDTFENGDYIYEAYKDIAFDIKYTPEPAKTDFWQTPLETVRLKKGDCEDAVFLFFSQMPSNLKNAEIVWGWVIDKQSKVGRAHVWYQLMDKRGQQYIVEGFSKDWNGIIPMEIVRRTETRKSIFTISHSAVSSFTGVLLEAENGQLCQSLVNLLTKPNLITHDSGDQSLPQYTNTLHHSDNELVEYLLDKQDNTQKYASHKYPTRSRMLPDTSKEISNILKKLHELFSRYERQGEGYDSNTRIAQRNGITHNYSERSLICRR
ncbi:MAG: hypothetical protein ACE5KZ_01850 [Candidatus Scalinduaceae bacterium]